MPEVYDRDGVWYTECYWYDEAHDKFRRARRSTRVKNTGAGSRQRAEIQAAAIERRIASGKDRRAGTTLQAALTKRAQALKVAGKPKSTRERARHSAAHLFELLGPDTELEEISADDLLAYADKRLERAAPDTVRRELADLSAAYGVLGLRCPQLPALPEPRVVERWLTESECAKLLEQAPSKRARVIMLVLQTGLRKGEVWRLVRIAPGVGRLMEPDENGGLKTGPRTIPLTPVADAILAAGPLDKWTNQGRDLKAYARRAGLGRVTWNDLRATPATLLLLADTAPARIAALLGHKSTKMIDRRYARIKSVNVSVADLAPLGALAVPDVCQGSSPLKPPVPAPAAPKAKESA